MNTKKPRGDDPSIGIEEFLDQMQPSVNKMYLEWKQGGFGTPDYLDEIVKYLDESTFAFDEHGNLHPAKLRQKNIGRLAVLLLIGAVEAAGEDSEEIIKEFINDK